MCCYALNTLLKNTLENSLKNSLETALVGLSWPNLEFLQLKSFNYLYVKNIDQNN